MKCQKCNKNEANVQYRESVNGVTREICLCEECARETGLLNKTSNMFAKMERQMLNAFANPFGRRALGGGFLGDSFFTEPFAEIGGFFENDPVEDMRLPITEAPANDKKERKNGQKEASAETEETLKAKLLDAIADERYEDAAKYRDKIKKLKGE